ncbi:MAG: hypothetical protein HQ559_02075 [Lentisphaerae bacterium]|nr:hypothetical protein [Lentisphaerota bacterium]
MARKNRKKTRTDGFVFPAPFAGVLVLISTLALAYVWLCGRCETLGEELGALEKKGEELGESFVKEQYKWTRLKSPRNLERRLAALDIQMQWPSREQVVHLEDPRTPALPSLDSTENALTYLDTRASLERGM